MRRRALLAAAIAAVAVAVAALAIGPGFAATLPVSTLKLTDFATPASIPASTCTVAASADTYVDEVNALLNYGTGGELHVKSAVLANKRSFVQFTLSGCAIPSTARVTVASLELYLSTAPSQARTYEVRRVGAAWGETTVSWSDQPAVAATATGSVSTGTTSGVWLNWDVATDVQAFVSGTATNNGWRVGDQLEGANTVALTTRLAAREAAANRPTLRVTYYP